MRLLAFGASNHSASINVALVRHASARFKEKYRPDAQVELLDINDFEMPIYSIDREKSGGVHDLAKDFYARIGASDALLISFPEYNGSYTSAWKNIYDWMSRIDRKVYQDKPTVALAATPGGRAGAGVLGSVEASAPHFGMDLRATVGIGGWGNAFDNEGGALVRPQDIEALDAALAKLV
ncbi:MAG: NAD(P)H-dependent oxidoreductase [Alphaproteobacteria bacterium]|nr:NAD(P)H-dependent oxidoreductase [Alphaproteobacteria bacterium]